jgi:phage shock protein C
MENNNQPTKMLYRSNTNRVIFGVCGGLGEYFNLDPIIFRLIFILLIFGAGSGIIIYLILALLVPQNPSSIHTESKTEPIDVHQRIQELAAELRELKRTHSRHRGGMFRLLFGLLISIIGAAMLAQSLNLIPGFYFNLSSIFTYLWPVVIILFGLAILSKGL